MPLVRKPTAPSPRPAASVIDIGKGLLSSSPEERWSAARAAAGVPRIASQLAAALTAETDPRVREVMLTSLARMGAVEITLHVLPLLRSTDAALRTGALEVLRTSATAVRGLLPALLHDPDSDVRILSCELARSLPSQEASAQLCALLLNERQVNVCTAAIEVLAEVGDEKALPILAQCGQRFATVPFVRFAVEVATHRLLAQSKSSRD